MDTKKSVLSILFMVLTTVMCLAGFLPAARAAEPVPARPSDLLYVYDHAGLIDQADEARMREVAKAIDDKTGAQVVVVTVNDLAGRTIEDYALTLFRSWGIGDREKNNGVLILVNKENLLAERSGRIRIEVGYGLEGTITDGKAGWILDTYALPAFEKREFSRGIADTFMAVAAEVAREYGLDLEQGELSDLSVYVREESIPFDLILAMLVFIVAAIIITSRGRRAAHRWPFDDHGPFWGPFSGGGFGGGFGGGSGFGGGFGGGGGSFGGGSSGGGGASR